MLQSLEARYNVKVLVLIDTSILSGNYRLIKVNAEGKEIAHKTTRAPRKRSRRGGSGSSSPARRPQRGGRPQEDGAGDETNEEATVSNVSEVGDDSQETSRGDASGTDESGEDRQRKQRGRRGRRGGRNKQRGDREGNPERAPREAREPREPREPRAPRGDRKPREEASGEAQSTTSSISPSHHASASRVIPMHDAAQPAAASPKLPPDIVSGNDDDKPKRKGWWNRVLEN
jgi:ribonuclease E